LLEKSNFDFGQEADEIVPQLQFQSLDQVIVFDEKLASSQRFLDKMV
jgi:hypothetical protein